MHVADSPSVEASTDSIILGIDDERYPPLLRSISDPPRQLYVRGDLAVLLAPQIAVVGSRKASAAALRLAESLSGELTRTGLSVCSGLALGIDGAAHRGALAAGGQTVAVVATGVDEFYPRRHAKLGQELLQSGCMISEYPPNTPPRRGNFPKRNRIISGLSLGVLVVEAALPSGSLITARTALEQGREVFALPWSILHEGGKGCLYLLRDGAKMVQSIADILEELGPLYTLQQETLGVSVEESGEPSEAVEPASPLLRLIGFEAITLDDVVSCSGQPVAKVIQELSALELSGHIVQCAGGYIRG